MALKFTSGFSNLRDVTFTLFMIFSITKLRSLESSSKTSDKSKFSCVKVLRKREVPMLPHQYFESNGAVETHWNARPINHCNGRCRSRSNKKIIPPLAPILILVPSQTTIFKFKSLGLSNESIIEFSIARAVESNGTVWPIYLLSGLWIIWWNTLRT